MNLNKRTLKLTFLSLAIFVLSLQLFATESLPQNVLGSTPLNQNKNYLTLPQSTQEMSELFISRDIYLISYNLKNHEPNWVSWRLAPDDIGHTGRYNIFNADPDLQTYLGANSTDLINGQDYMGSCYDRGHQTPSADRDTTQDLNKETFFMSNMIPQTAYLNRVIWEHLENYTRDLVQKQNKTVYIYAGPIFDENFGMIGSHQNIKVPSKNFKILFIFDNNSPIKNQTPEIVSVIMPNILQNGKKPNEDKNELCLESKNLNATNNNKITTDSTQNNDWMQYKTSLDEVEKLSGYKFNVSNFN